MRSRGLCSTPRELSSPRPGGGRCASPMPRACRLLGVDTGGGLSGCGSPNGGPRGLACRGLCADSSWLWLLEAGLLLFAGDDGGLTATTGEPLDALLLCSLTESIPEVSMRKRKRAEPVPVPEVEARAHTAVSSTLTNNTFLASRRHWTQVIIKKLLGKQCSC